MASFLFLKKENFKLSNPFFGILVLSVFFPIVISAIAYFSDLKTFQEGYKHTSYNNFVIFRNSFFHLIQNKDLYQWYLNEQWDLYKYTPTFSVLFSPIAILPAFVGLIIWNILNFWVFVSGIFNLPQLKDKKVIWIFLFFISELILSTQNHQSNALLAGLMIWTYILLERNKSYFASLIFLIGVFLKPFAIVVGIFFLFYPGKLRNAIYLGLNTLILFALPLLFVSFEQLLFLYKSWLNVLNDDHAAKYGISVAGWLQSWFAFTPNKNLIVLFGMLLFLSLFRSYKYFQDKTFQALVLASVLLWVVIFNHMAESPTFIIAMGGIAIWYFAKDRSKTDLSLIIISFIFTGLSATDIFPKTLRENYFLPYVIKVVPCIIIWLKVSWELFSFEKNITCTTKV